MQDISVMLSGFVRKTNKFCLESLYQEIIKPFNANVYCQIYDNECLNEFVDNYKPSRLLLTHEHEPIADLSPQIVIDKKRIKGTLYMWRNVHRVFDLIPREKEKIILRSRYDLCYDNSFKSFIQNSLNVDQHTIIIPAGGDALGGLFDMVAIGRYESMRAYSSLYGHIEEYLEAGVPFHTETLLKYHLKSQNIRILRPEVPVGLIREGSPNTIFRANVTTPGRPQILGHIK